MKKGIFILGLVLCLIGCVRFELKEGKCGFKGHYTTPCVTLTSKDFWVDRTDLTDIIEAEGGDIRGCNWTKVFWTVEGDIQKHIKRLRPKIREWAIKNLIKGP